MCRSVGTVRKGLILSWLLLFWLAGICAADWPSWRGPQQNGYSTAENLVSTWAANGENLIWKADFIGRSTPIALDGRVYVIGRTGEGITEQEQVAAFDGESGDLIWEYRFNVFHSTIPFNRLGWTSLAGDPQTGNVYAHSTSGQFVCFDRDGRVVWARSLTEEFGRISGYGGRLHTPVVDGQLVVISFLNNSWGAQGATRHRYYAFDKDDGRVVWIATPGGPPKDTTYSTPVIADIDGQRLLVAGNADGSVYAMKVQTGEKVWGFKLSKRGINASVVVEGNRVYVSHGEENLDNTAMGRVVCIDGSGRGDITQTHEVWRWDGHMVGYTSPLLADNRLYVIDNSANLYSLDAGSGQVHWSYSLGTVGKGSPVWADGKLFATEVNGGFHIIEPQMDSAQGLHTEKIQVAGEERLAEIYGSPAVAYGRIYFTTEEGLYCLGDPALAFAATSSGAKRQPHPKADKKAKPAAVQLVPAEVLLQPGKSKNLKSGSTTPRAVLSKRPRKRSNGHLMGSKAKQRAKP